MDGSVDHSDSESGDSWTLLDHSPIHANEAPEFPENHCENRNLEKDEDTDGISIISESEPESPMPGETLYEIQNVDETTFEEQVSQCIHDASPISEDNMLADTMDEDDFLVENTVKHKTYVHRRNKRLSTVLNIIVLGSVITAAGVAIGHMWGAKNDCSMNTTPSVNKILSSLYKLQEENAYLRSKLKELTLIHNVHAYRRKSGTESISNKPNKCTKVFEDSIYNVNADKPIRCVDNDDTSGLDVPLMKTQQQKEFLNDIDKLKNVYNQNKSWLDIEVSRRLNLEEQNINNLKKDIKKHKETTQMKGEFLETINEVLNTDVPTSDEKSASYLTSAPKNTDVKQERKISYADCLKSDVSQKVNQRKVSNLSDQNEIKGNLKKRNAKDLNTVSGHSISEDEVRKDDRYIEQKFKPERKKYDRQKLHKKQKRKNKYEQWEMKGGYLKDYDDFSVTSSQENEYVMKKADNNVLAKDFERENYIAQFLDTDNLKKSSTDKDVVDSNTESEKNKDTTKNLKNKAKKANWYDKRAQLRNEARKKLELELFGETSPNNAGWYFRRMQRREQCRAKGDNSTHRKLSKRNMNFKTKH